MTVAAIVSHHKQAPHKHRFCEVDGLVDELIAEEGLAPIEAVSAAAGLLDELDAYVASWDSMAFVAGNAGAM